MEFKFQTSISAISEANLNKLNLSKASMMSAASNLLLKPERNNFDILPVLFSVALVNQFNANDDAIETIDAAKMLPLFANKPINIEHNKNFIVGHIIKASFANSDPDLYENDVLDFVHRKDPFYISSAGFIYKSIYPELADAIVRASDPDDETYQSYSTSWEINFEYYDIAIGDSDKTSECSMVEFNSLEHESYQSFLKCNGGTGYLQDGRKVKRVIKGNKIPIGIGITENPAAKVKGIYSLASIDKKISTNKETAVTETEISIKSKSMDEKQFEELKNLITSCASANTSNEAFEKIQNLLTQEGQGWKSKSDQAVSDLAQATKNIEELTKEIEDSKNKVEELTRSLHEREASETYNSRMDSLASEFALNEDEEKIVALEVKDLPLTQDAFDAYLAKARVIFNHRKKNAQEPTVEKEVEVETPAVTPSVTVASVFVDPKTPATIPNGNGDSSQNLTLFQRLQKEGLQIEK